MGWIWRKGISVLKKIIGACIVLTSAPFIFPPLIVATAIALISSLPYCFLLVSYVFTEKLMSILLPPPPPPPPPPAASGDKMMLLVPNKIEHGYTYDDADHQESRRSLLETIRDEVRTKPSSQLDRGISEKELKEENNEARSEGRTRHEGELNSTTTKASRRKSSNEVKKILYSEEQIWTKMEALRKVVGYSVARSTTYSEELEALYLFTGVELPTTTEENENQDLVEEVAQVSQRLAFLTSLVGIQ